VSWEPPLPYTTVAPDDALSLVTGLVVSRDAHPVIVGVGGSVAVGKSTFAAALAARVPVESVEVVSTDGFLLSNATLAARGLGARKGFPESYDEDLARTVLSAIVRCDPSVRVPGYSHRTYDVDGSARVLGRPDVVIVEGVNALAAPFAPYLSLGVYLDADEEDIRGWFVTRFESLVAEAAGDHGSFFATWLGLPSDQITAIASVAWDRINRVNLVEHILPTRWQADVVLRKGADHTITHVAVRA